MYGKHSTDRERMASASGLPLSRMIQALRRGNYEYAWRRGNLDGTEANLRESHVQWRAGV